MLPSAPADATTSAVSDAAIMAVLFDKPGFLLARIDQIATALHAAHTPETTLAQSEFLLLLERLAPVPQITLARAGGVDKSTTGLVLDNLEARDLIARAPCAEDRRRLLVSLTAVGRAALGEVRTAFDSVQHDLLEPLGEDAGARLVAMLHRIGSNTLSAATPWGPAGVLDHAPSFLFRRVLQHLQATFAAADPTSRITFRQFALLYILSRRESISQIGFARLYGLDPSTCGVILRALAKRGLLSAEASPSDGRERIFRLTDAGRTALGTLQVLADRSARAALRGESPADTRWLVSQLRQIVAAYSGRLRFPGFLPDDLSRA
jgi:DNA-binding MarR family transcriptional regulator